MTLHSCFQPASLTPHPAPLHYIFIYFSIFFSPFFIKKFIFFHLASLHWLPTDSRIQYKLASLYYNCLNSTSPCYLTELLEIYNLPVTQLITCQIPSFSDTSIVCFPSVCARSEVFFFFLEQYVWNSLPCEVRSSKHTLIIQNCL